MTISFNPTVTSTGHFDEGIYRNINYRFPEDSRRITGESGIL
jgi:hypothetical protein